jgi:TPR repeat protein
MDTVLSLIPESHGDWYEAILSAQPDGVGLEEKDRNKFNHAFESFTAGSYDNAYEGFVELAKGGSSISQYYLGLMYISGMGVLQDFRQAHMWLNIASSRGHKKARKQLEKLSQKMTADQLAGAQKLARRRIAKINEKCGSSAKD